MHANEPPTQTADSSCEGDRQLPLVGADRAAVDEAMRGEALGVDEDVPEEAGYGYGV